MADVIPFPRKRPLTYNEKLVLWTVKVIDEMVSIGKAKQCNLHITPEGLKDIERFEPNPLDIQNAYEYLKPAGAVEL